MIDYGQWTINSNRNGVILEQYQWNSMTEEWGLYDSNGIWSPNIAQAAIMFALVAQNLSTSFAMFAASTAIVTVLNYAYRLIRRPLILPPLETFNLISI